jgi:CRP/FNR family cyclic AMP-dependent transcriptional regulator
MKLREPPPSASLRLSDVKKPVPLHILIQSDARGKGLLAHSSLLAQVPLFAGLNQEQFDRLELAVRPRHYAKGAVIFLAGDPGTSLCLIQSGRVKLGFTSAEGREVILDLFGPSEFFGELALLDGEPRSADAVAIESTQILHVVREEFLHFLREDRDHAIELLGVLSRRLRRDAQLLQDAAFLDVPARLARTILRLAQPSDTGERRTPRMTQNDLAGLVGTTRETLNVWLRFFQDEGLIRWERGEVAVLRPDGLQKRIY